MDDSNDGLIESRGEYQAALLRAFALIAESSASEIWMCDADFADWPLNEPQVVEQLTRWSVAHRRCHVLALNFELLPRRHPRWVQWRRHRSHVVSCMTPDDSGNGRLPGRRAAARRGRCAFPTFGRSLPGKHAGTVK
jgi:hypothetical protein